MLDLRFDASAFERETRRIDGAFDQIPFALSRSLNGAVNDARAVLVQDTWPQHVTVRNRSFLGAMLRIVYSKKDDLRVEINDLKAQGRGHLALHASGGTRVAFRGRLAIPPKGTVTRTASGVRKSQRPAAIIAQTPKRALRITAGGIFVGIKGKLTLKYLLRRSVQQPADVPFQEAFDDAMIHAVRSDFARQMKQAMQSRR
jgi:hypothetical protein